MLSDTHYTILNVWLFKNDKFTVLLQCLTSSNDILHLKMEDPYWRWGWDYNPMIGGGSDPPTPHTF